MVSINIKQQQLVTVKVRSETCDWEDQWSRPATDSSLQIWRLAHKPRPRQPQTHHPPYYGAAQWVKFQSLFHDTLFHGLIMKYLKLKVYKWRLCLCG